MTAPTFSEVLVVGMHFRGNEVKALVANFYPPLDLRLEREATNAFDSNAIKVLYEDTHIGYVKGTDAAFIAPYMDEGVSFTCRVEEMVESGRNMHPSCTIAPA